MVVAAANKKLQELIEKICFRFPSNEVPVSRPGSLTNPTDLRSVPLIPIVMLKCPAITTN